MAKTCRHVGRMLIRNLLLKKNQHGGDDDVTYKRRIHTCNSFTSVRVCVCALLNEDSTSLISTGYLLLPSKNKDDLSTIYFGCWSSYLDKESHNPPPPLSSSLSPKRSTPSIPGFLFTCNHK